MAQVSLRKVVKRFDDTEAVRGIDLDIADKEFVVLVGPSGCGKSTTLRMIAGLEDITDGEIAVDGEVVNDVPPKDRDMAMVFQNYALYPHMTVYENMSFGLRLKRFPKAEIARRVQEAARILDITELLDRKPRQLSGGQRQRVAMGRAIVRNPKVFLFDEPLSNLDAKLRVQMRTEIKRVHQKVRTTTVYVTHDQVEAMTLADRVVVMNRGKIEQIGAPNDLYHSPKTRFVAGFIGSPAMNFVPCRLEEADGALRVRLTDEIALPVPPSRAARYRPHVGRDGLTFGLRPEHLTEAQAQRREAARLSSMPSSKSPSRSAWRRWCSSASTAVDICGAGEPGRRRARRRAHAARGERRQHAPDRGCERAGALTRASPAAGSWIARPPPRPPVCAAAATWHDPPTVIEEGNVKLVLFQAAGSGEVLPGLLVERGVVSIAEHVKLGYTPQLTMQGIIDDFERLRPTLERLAVEGEATPLDAVRLRPPLPRPGKILRCIANYWEHAQREPRPLNMFMKNPDAVVGPGRHDRAAGIHRALDLHARGRARAGHQRAGEDGEGR